MLHKKIIEVVKAFYGKEARLIRMQEGIIISYPAEDGEFEEDEFPSDATFLDYVKEERRKLGVALYLCRENYNLYKTGIPELDTPMFTGVKEGADHQVLMQRQDTLIRNIRSRKHMVFASLVTGVMLALALSLLYVNAVISQDTMPAAFTMVAGMVVCFSFSVFAIWRNYRDQRLLIPVKKS